MKPEQFIKQTIPKNSTIIIGFSGGPDSVYLLLLLQSMQKNQSFNLIAAHLDHQWRPESANEALWCKDFCEKRNIPYITGTTEQFASKISYNGSKEAFARCVRRTFFKHIAQNYQNPYIVLAHHKDDQLETFFIRLARGSSLAGLCGMKKIDGMYIRPLLDMSKQTILDYLHNHQIPYLNDPTNQSATFLRNRIRLQLIPLLDNIDPRMKNNLEYVMQHFQDTELFLKELTHHQELLLQNPKDQNYFFIKPFLDLNQIMQYRLILNMLIKQGATFTPSKGLLAEIVRFLHSNKHSEHFIHKTYKILKSKNSFSIIKR